MSNTTLFARRSMAQLFFDYNPFYLLSAMCMLAGIFALNNALRWSPLPLKNILYLIATLNVYEGMLIALGIFLLRRGLMRDAMTLLVIEAFFLVDAGFLNSEIFTLNFSAGLIVNAALLILATIKVAAIFRALNISLTDLRYALVLAQMFILLAAPGWFKYFADHHNGALSPSNLYAFWWIVGVIVICCAIAMNRRDSNHRWIINTFILLPVISLIAHLSTSNWVFKVDWFSANLSPLVLGLAVAVGIRNQYQTISQARTRAALLLPLLAILLAAPTVYQLNFNVLKISITPLRLTLIAAALVYAHLLIHHKIFLAIAAIVFITAASLGDSFDEIYENLAKILSILLPDSTTKWGVISVIAAFVMLALGTMLSLAKSPTPQKNELG
jgi:hypothetical protein